MWQAMLAGAGLGTAKHFLSDKPKYAADAKLAAAQTRYSPWSGMGRGVMPERASLFNNIMQGASMGAGMGQQMGGGGAKPQSPTFGGSGWDGMSSSSVGPMAPGTEGGRNYDDYLRYRDY